MARTKDNALVRYEYIAYIHLLEIDSVREILLTLDDSVDIMAENEHIKWTPVRNLNIDVIDLTDDNGSSYDASSKKIINRICGLFDAEPLDWKYARILVDNKSCTKDNFAIAKVPRSPITPIMFEINE